MYSIRKINDKIYCVWFNDRYNMCMHFLRYQEFYESPSDRFRNKSFTIFDFMAWYSAAFGKGAFTYVSDWVGFNIPAQIILKVRNLGIPDPNQYDAEMFSLYQTIWAKYPEAGEDFYLIGTASDPILQEKGLEKFNDAVLSHEIAHGMYATNILYRKSMDALCEGLKLKFRSKVYDWLEKIGYTSEVFQDELQAYMSTGFPDSANIKVKKKAKPFEDLFKLYTKDIKVLNDKM